jgi:endonuclease/exonuclease/phosphatase (EEP) superfamily protein YafD
MATQLRVFCWNIGMGEYGTSRDGNIAEIIETIRAKSPDIVLLNEVIRWFPPFGKNQPEEIAKGIGLPYFVADRTANLWYWGIWHGYKAVAIYSRYPLSPPKVHRISSSFFVEAHAILETTITIDNRVHHLFSARFDQDDVKENTRGHELARDLVNNVPASAAVIFGGDFNCRSSEPQGVMFFTSTGLSDSLKEFHDPLMGNPGEIIDFVYYRGPYHVTRMERREKPQEPKPSDHPWHYVELTRDHPRIGVVHQDGNVYVKEGGLDATWVLEMDQSQALALWGDRLGVLQNGGNVYVKRGGLDASWVLQMDQCQALALWGDRIGVLRNGNVYVKEGGLDASWVLQMDQCQALALWGDRIGVLRNGDVYVKEFGLGANWVLEADQCQALALTSNRIGVLRNGEVLVKEGGLDSNWVLEADQCQSLALWGKRIGVLRNNEVLVKEGALGANWVVEADQCQGLALSSNRIGVLRNNEVLVKEGALDAFWTLQTSNTRNIALT